MKTRNLIFIILLSLISSNYAFKRPVCTPKKVLVFDLGGTLFRVNYTTFIKEFSLIDGIGYLLSGNSIQRIKELTCAILDAASPFKHTHAVRAPDGTKAPHLMCDWMAGRISTQEAQQRARVTFSLFRSRGLFTSQREERLIKQAITCAFDPVLIARSMRPIKRMVYVLRKCVENGHTLVILSNLSSDTYQELAKTEHGQKIFKHFPQEHIFISADIKRLKPHKNSYDFVYNKIKALSQCNHIQKHQCILIDDQHENTVSAQEYGFKTVHIKSHRIKKARKALKALAII